MPSADTGLHVAVTEHTQDLGAAAPARTPIAYAARSGDARAETVAENLPEALWKHRDDLGTSAPGPRADYERVNDPTGRRGTMPNGDPIDANSTFMSIRSFYRGDPDYERVWAHANGAASTVPVVRCHRFRMQAGIAVAMADYGFPFNE